MGRHFFLGGSRIVYTVNVKALLIFADICILTVLNAFGTETYILFRFSHRIPSNTAGKRKVVLTR